MEWMTGIEPALSAWELACHAPCDQRFPGHGASGMARECPSGTGCYCSIGRATGTQHDACHYLLIRRDSSAYPPDSGALRDAVAPDCIGESSAAANSVGSSAGPAGGAIHTHLR